MINSIRRRWNSGRRFHYQFRNYSRLLPAPRIHTPANIGKEKSKRNNSANDSCSDSSANSSVASDVTEKKLYRRKNQYGSGASEIQRSNIANYMPRRMVAWLCKCLDECYRIHSYYAASPSSAVTTSAFGSRLLAATIRSEIARNCVFLSMQYQVSMFTLRSDCRRCQPTLWQFDAILQPAQTLTAANLNFSLAHNRFYP